MYRAAADLPSTALRMQIQSVSHTPADGSLVTLAAGRAVLAANNSIACPLKRPGLHQAVGQRASGRNLRPLISLAQMPMHCWGDPWAENLKT